MLLLEKLRRTRGGSGPGFHFLLPTMPRPARSARPASPPHSPAPLRLAPGGALAPAKLRKTAR